MISCHLYNCVTLLITYLFLLSIRIPLCFLTLPLFCYKIILGQDCHFTTVPLVRNTVLRNGKKNYNSENDSTSAWPLALGKDNHALCVNEYQFAWLGCPAEGVLGETAPAPLSCTGEQQKHRGLEEPRAGLWLHWTYASLSHVEHQAWRWSSMSRNNW